jgi:hypothetical protein
LFDIMPLDRRAQLPQGGQADAEELERWQRVHAPLNFHSYHDYVS